MSKPEFDIEYKKWLSQLNEEVDTSLWEDIQNELDLIDTWDNLSLELDKHMPVEYPVSGSSFIKTVVTMAAIALLVFLPVKQLKEHYIEPVTYSSESLSSQELSEEEMGIGGAVQHTSEAVFHSELSNEIERTSYSPDSKKPLADEIIITIDESDYTTQIYPDDFPDEQFSKHDFSDEQFIKDDFPETQSGKNDLNEEHIAGHVRKDELPDFQNSLINISDVLAGHFISLPEVDKLNSIHPPAASVIKSGVNLNGSSGITINATSVGEKRSGAFIRLVDAGVSYTYKNSWLLNYETRNGLNPQKLGNTLLTFHKDIGLSSTWAVSGKPVLGIEFLWNSQTGQKYQQYIDASYLNRDILLTYMRLQALYIWDYRNIPGQLVAGGYAASLNAGSETRGDVSFGVRNQYRNFDYGLILGYQYSIPLQKGLVLTPGLRFSYNLVNLFEGDSNIPSHFKNTRNFTSGFNLAVSYRMFN